MKYFIIAGERSGDLHGSNLIKALIDEDPKAEIMGLGGDEMQKAGMELLVHYKNMSFMGIGLVIRNIFRIYSYLKLCKSRIASFKPDVVILIDYAGFNLRIARFARRNNFKVCYYITPKVWAWNASRAKKIKAFVDQVLVILPFEVDFFKKYGVIAHYVGNPVQDAVRAHQVDSNFFQKHNFDPEKKIIALLPGSRQQELKHLLPIMLKVSRKYETFQFAVAGVRTLPTELYDIVEDYPDVSVVHEDTYNLLAHSFAALVTSGTATLETALWNVPQVVVYKANRAGYTIGKWLVLKNIKYFSLVNLISEREVVKELLQSDADVKKVGIELSKILVGEPRERVLQGYRELKEKLAESHASATAAGLIQNLIGN